MTSAPATAAKRPREPASPWLGAIADDYTGATDLAAMAARQGMRTIQYLGVPTDVLADDADCVIVALKSRSSPVADAITESLAAARWLQGLGVDQLYFKYCSTFDSTDEGNIGPVADALAELVGAHTVVFLPATPAHRRTTYFGHHFVADQLLSESPLRDHPINPMTDPDLRRVLSRQTATPVALLDLATIRRGAAATALAGRAGRVFFVADALDDEDVLSVARATRDAPLVTGGAALAEKLAQLRRTPAAAAPDLEIPEGPAIVLAGSCSPATLRQLEVLGTTHPRFTIDAHALDRGENVIGAALTFIQDNRERLPVLAASREPGVVRQVQEDLGIERSARLVENALADIARGAVAAGVRRILVAGGESSGAVVQGLGVRALRIGPEVAPGVPWTVSIGDEPIGLLLKSGNLGGDSVFTDALALADAE